MLSNLSFCVKKVCTNPYSVIVTLDLDDVLLTQTTLSFVERLQYIYHHENVWITIGGMLRPEKITNYSVNLINPRTSRLFDGSLLVFFLQPSSSSQSA